MATVTGKPKRRRKALTAVEMVQAQKLCRERLLSDLHEQEASAGTPLPGERTLSEQYGIPLSVIRSTLKKLKSEGLITSVPRGGVRLVAPPELPKSLVGVKVAFVGYIELTHPGAQYTQAAVICSGLERVLNEQGGTLQFFNLWGVDDFQVLIREIQQQKIDAIIYHGTVHSMSADELQALAGLGLPMVSTGAQSSLCARVTFDDRQIGRRQAEHILDLGHRTVCILEFPEHEWSTVRAQSIRDEFRKRGLPEPDRCTFAYPVDPGVTPADYLHFGLTYPSLVAEMKEFVRRRASTYTACIAVNDELGCLLLTEAKAQGIRVPENLSVIGADDHPAFRHFNLTTLQLSDMELGLDAFKILKEQILKPKTRKGAPMHLLTCPLIVRGTTAQPQERKEP
jgi:DNA-binding LacI/PurR family transcriptional regulator